MPLVSVLIPVFNSAPYLRQALESVGRQSFDDLEIVTVNDGSTDETSAILREFAAIEPRLRVTERENRGIIATRNQLLSSARGKYVAWMDSDDVSLPQRLALQVRAFEDDPTLVCVGCNVRRVDPEGGLLDMEYFPEDHVSIVEQQLRGGAMRFPATMVRRDIALQVGGFREPFRIGEDFDFLLRVSEIGGMHNIQETLYLYRQHLFNTCTSYLNEWGVYRDAILSLHAERVKNGKDRLQLGGEIILPSPRQAVNAINAAITYASWSIAADRMGDRRRARGYALSSLRAKPSALVGWKAVARLCFVSRNVA